METSIKLLIALSSTAIIIGILLHFMIGAREEACIDLGYEELVTKRDFEFCKDIDGNLHLVEISDEAPWSLFHSKFSAKEIKIGGVF